MKFKAQLREAMGEMTPPELATLSGVRVLNVYRYLQGEREPALSQLQALEYALPALRRIRTKSQPRALRGTQKRRAINAASREVQIPNA